MSECVCVWMCVSLSECVRAWVSEWVWVCVWVWVSECACCLLLKNVSDVLNEHSCIVSLHALLLILTNLNENSCILSLACCCCIQQPVSAIKIFSEHSCMRVAAKFLYRVLFDLEWFHFSTLEVEVYLWVKLNYQYSSLRIQDQIIEILAENTMHILVCWITSRTASGQVN